LTIKHYRHTLEYYMDKNVIERIYQTLMDTKLKIDGTNTKSPIKKYFINHVLSQSPFEFKSKLLEQNLFSVSAYGSQLEAFIKEIESYNFPRNTNIIVHPLLPINCIDHLINLGMNIVYTELDYNTLNFKANSLSANIKSHNPALIIHFTINQLLNELTSFLNTNQNIEILVIDDSKYFNQEFFRLIDSSQSLKYIKFQDLPIKSLILKDFFDTTTPIDKVYFALDISPELMVHTINKAPILIDNDIINTMVYKLDSIYNLGMVNKVKNSFLFNTKNIQKTANIQDSIEMNLNKISDKNIDDFWFYIYNIIEDGNTVYSNQLKSNLEKLFARKKSCLELIHRLNLPINQPKDYLIRDSTALQISSEDIDQMYQILFSSGYQFYRLPTMHNTMYGHLTQEERKIINSTLITLL
jgi:hypothetical protein